ncbi:MAG TPA: transposase [bacterium]
MTICAHNRLCLFGEIIKGRMRLNGWGMLVKDEWARIHQLRQNVELDAFVIMPNHVHGIVCILDYGTVQNPDVGARRASPLRMGVRPGSLGAIVGAFKSALTRMINLQRGTIGNPVWQRNYYEHIIHNDREIEEIREYIINNPAQWAEDEFNPDNVGVRRASPFLNP